MNDILIRLKRNIILLLPLLCLWGCGRSHRVTGSEEGLRVYYVNREETSIFSEPYTLVTQENDTRAVVEELLTEIERVPDKLEYEAPIAADVHLTAYSVDEGVLTMRFTEDYRDIDPVREILLRAATVRTLTQVEGIDFVTFFIGDEPLTDAKGNIIGNMTADTFIYNAGNEINAYEQTSLTLYFASEEGDELIAVRRTVVYNSNITLERLVIDQLLSGPQTDIAFPTLNPQTQVITVNLTDGICYVDFNGAFLVEPYQVQPEVAVYSVVNSLTELPGVNKVQLLVNGETAVDFMDTVNLGSLFERNLDLVH